MNDDTEPVTLATPTRIVSNRGRSWPPPDRREHIES